MLKAQALALRQEAKNALRVKGSKDVSASKIIFTNAEWLEWMQEHEEEFAEKVRTPTAARKTVREKITPLSDPMPQVCVISLGGVRDRFWNSGWLGNL